jgi:hypothetical protein
MTMQTFATSENAKPNTKNVGGLSLAVVKRTTVQVTTQPLYYEIHELGHDLLCQAYTDTGLVYVLYIHILELHVKV